MLVDRQKSISEKNNKQTEEHRWETQMHSVASA